MCPCLVHDSIQQVTTHKHLGLTLDCHLSWLQHTSAILSKVSCKIGLLLQVRRRLPALVIQSFYTTCFRPTLEYASVAWCGMGASDAERLERIQRAAARLIANVSVADQLPRDLLLARAGLECLRSRRCMHCAVLA